MNYACQTKDGRYYAVIERDDGDELDRKEAPSKFEAMALRDAARNAGAKTFDDAGEPAVQSGPTELKAPTDPAPEPVVSAQEPAPAAAAEKPKRTRKPKATEPSPVVPPVPTQTAEKPKRKAKK